jgi:hypothetical protein
MPLFKVILAMGHPPQAPVNLTVTTPSLTSISWTSPPSANSAGLTCSRAACTFSRISLSLSVRLPDHPVTRAFKAKYRAKVTDCQTSNIGPLPGIIAALTK